MILVGFILSVILYNTISAQVASNTVTAIFESKKELGRSFAKSKLMRKPNSLIIDKNELIYTNDPSFHRILVISKDFKSVSIFAGGGEDTLKFGRGENGNVPGIESMCFDSNGNMIATSSYKHVLLKISSRGEVSLFSGSSEGYLDGPLALAKFDKPIGILIDKNDNIFVSEGSALMIYGGNRIRKISNIGIVSTIAGGSGIGLLDGQGLQAKFHNPQKLEFDKDGNILICDADNHAIRVLNSTGYVHTLAGGNGWGLRDGSFDYCQFNYPRSMVVDDEGDIYVGDMRNNAIRKLIRKTKTVVTVAGNGLVGFYDGLGKDSQLNNPHDLKFAPDRINIIIADYDNSALRSFNTKSTMVSTIVERESQGLQDGFGSNALLFSPKFLTVDKNNDIFVSDTANHVIRKVTQNGTVSTFSGFGGVSGFLDGRSSEALFYAPHGICYEPTTDSFFVMDNLNARVRKVFRNGSVTTVAGSGEKGNSDGYGVDATFENPYGCTIFNGYLYFTDWENHLIRRMNLNTSLVEKWVGVGSAVYQNGPRLSSGMMFPTGICSDSTGNLYFTDQYNEIRKVDVNGVVSTVAGNAYASYGYAEGVGSNAKFCFPEGLECSNDGKVFVADKFNAMIRQVVVSTRAVTPYAGKNTNWGHGKRTGKTMDARFSLPYGTALATNGDLYIADTLNDAIKVVEKASARVKAVAGGGSPLYRPGTIEIDRLRNPQGIIAHPVTRQIFIADTGNGLIHNWEAPQMKIYAGSGSDGWFDNPNDKRDSEFFNPHGIAFTRNGSGLLVVDTYNHVIREITEMGVRTIAGTGEYGNGFGAALSSKFNHPKYIVLDSSGNIIVADSGNHVIKRISTSNIVATLVGAGTPGFKDDRSTRALLYHPIGLSFDSSNNLWIVDSYNHAIRFFNSTSNMLITIAGTGDPGFDDGMQNATFSNPSGIAYDEMRDRFYICDTGNNAVRMITKEGSLYKVSTIVSENLFRPSDLVLASDNQLLILDAGQNALKLYSFNKAIYTTTTSLSSGLSGGIVTIIALSTTLICGVMIAAYMLVIKRYNGKKSVQMNPNYNSYSHSLTGRSMSRGRESNNVSKLIALSQKDSTTVEASNTLNLSKSVAVALPGYLLINNLSASISFNSKNGPDSDMKSGGTATVHKGCLIDKNLISQHQITDVAVKIIDGDRKNGSQIFESFKYEVTLMSSLPPSPYLVKLVGYSMNPLAIVMKSYAMSLQEALDRCDFFPNQNIKLKAAKEIALGMQIIHSKDIIHFDLKPGNILIDINADMSFNFLICDFGFADYAPEAEKQFVAGMKRPSVQGITPRYAAPELFVKTALGSVSYINYKKVDIYAYALIILYVATGDKPWGNLDPSGIEENALKGLRPVIPESVLNDWSFITECWCQDPNARLTFDQILTRINQG